MNHERELKLMAYLDGELSSCESDEVDGWLRHDPQGRALLEELRSTRAALQANEPEHPLPVSPDFYWSQIARAIERDVRGAEPAAHRRPWWAGWLAPAGATAVTLALAVLAFQMVRQNPALGVGDEIATGEDGGDSITFRSEADAITVVWLGGSAQ